MRNLNPEKAESLSPELQRALEPLLSAIEWLMLIQRAVGLPFKPLEWLGLPVMRRIAISTPNVMTALRKLNRDQARPYNFALSPVLTILSDEPVLLLGPFTKDARRWKTMPYINIYDGKAYTLEPPTLLAVPHTFDLMFAQYWRHPEFKSRAPGGSPCKADTRGLLKRCPVSAAGFHFIGKETEPGNRTRFAPADLQIIFGLWRNYRWQGVGSRTTVS